jgi:hypothetical protein
MIILEHRRLACLIIVLAAGLGLSGCELPAGEPMEMKLDTAGAEKRINFYPLSELLHRCVGSDGYLVPVRYEANRDLADRQLRQLAVTGPTATPELLADDDVRLAWWYNARAAWSMEIGMALRKMDIDDVGVMNRVTFPLDGRRMTLGAIDGEIQSLGGFWAVICAPGVALCRAPLPENPLMGPGIHETIFERLNTFVDDPNRFEIDVASRSVKVPPLMWMFREKIIAAYRRKGGGPQASLLTALLWFVEGSPARRLQDAVGYAVQPNTDCTGLGIRQY